MIETLKRIAMSILAIARFYSAWFFKSRLWIINQLVIPVSMYIVFLLVIGKGFEVNALIGGLITLAWNAGSNALSQQLFAYRFYYRILDMFIASPVTSTRFIAGVSIGALLNALLPSIPILTLLATYIGINMVLLIPLFLLAWLLGSIIGFFMANTVKDPARFSALANLLYYLLTIIPPVYYPANVIPGIGYHISLLIPTATLAELARMVLALTSATTLWYVVAVILVYMAVFLLLAVRYAEWREH